MTHRPRLLAGLGATGEDSESALSPSWLTRLGDRAAERNNHSA